MPEIDIITKKASAKESIQSKPASENDLIEFLIAKESESSGRPFAFSPRKPVRPPVPQPSIQSPTDDSQQPAIVQPQARPIPYTVPICMPWLQSSQGARGLQGTQGLQGTRGRQGARGREGTREAEEEQGSFNNDPVVGSGEAPNGVLNWNDWAPNPVAANAYWDDDPPVIPPVIPPPDGNWNLNFDLDAE